MVYPILKNGVVLATEGWLSSFLTGYPVLLGGEQPLPFFISFLPTGIVHVKSYGLLKVYTVTKAQDRRDSMGLCAFEFPQLLGGM